MNTMGTSEELFRLTRPIWEAQVSHPFVQGIGDGTLALAKFGLWLKQDYLFLIEYARVMGYAAARAPDLATMRGFATVMHQTLLVEMDLHRSYVGEFGITAADLESEQKLPTTQAYADFLLRTAATADFAEVAAAALPCMWDYSELGRHLAGRGQPEDERYARWITAYAADEFTELARWCRAVVDEAAATLEPGARRRMEEAFITSSRYELAFWDMAWRGESWASGVVL
jgi:thiaminase (transcriptional activator TenA)